MIDAVAVFQAFQQHRGKSIVIATGVAGQHWRDISTDENRDVILGGAMGHTTPAALGLAVAQPSEKIVLFDSEGSLLMNLGILATVAGKKPKNFYHILLDNECYATTGGQPVPNAQGIDYAGMARDAGYAAGYHFDDLEDFAINLGRILNEPGPVLVSMKIVPEIENLPIGLRQQIPGRSRAQAIQDLQEELGITVV